MKNFDRNDLLNLNEINRKQIIKKKIEPGALYDARNIKELPKFPQQPNKMLLMKQEKQYEPGIAFEVRNIKELPKFTQQPIINRPPMKPQKQFEPGISFDARTVGNLPFRPKYNKLPSVKPKERIKNEPIPEKLTYKEVIAKNIKERERIAKVAILGDFNDLLPEPNINGSMFEDDVEVDIDSDDEDLPTRPFLAGMILAGMVSLGFGLYK